MKEDTDNPQPQKTAPQLDNILNELKKQVKESGGTTESPLTAQKPTTIDEKLRRQQIENDKLEKDQELKENTLKKLFRFLSIETAIIFALAFLQGFRWWRFKMDEWSFRLVITATIGQITAMLTIAVQHLFPKKKK